MPPQSPPHPEWQIDIVECHPAGVSPERIELAVQTVLSAEQMGPAHVVISIVSDQEIHRANREFLEHDEPTDVLSFRLDDGSEERLDGEILVSVDTAHRRATLNGWSSPGELILYVVHGVLHLCGHDDQEDQARTRMFARERQLMTDLGWPEIAASRIAEE